MSDEDLEHMARSAGLLEVIDDAYLARGDWLPEARAFASLVQSAERERCAQYLRDAAARDETQQKLVAMLRKDAYDAATIAKHYADENKVLRRERDQARSAIGAATNTYEVASSIAKSCIEDTNKLRAFAQAIMEAWPEGGIEGDDLQEIALKHGMLAPEIRHEPCGEWCNCNSLNGLDSNDWERGVECYRRTALLTGGEQ